jgi:hypothetical protein
MRVRRDPRAFVFRRDASASSSSRDFSRQSPASRAISPPRSTYLINGYSTTVRPWVAIATPCRAPDSRGLQRRCGSISAGPPPPDRHAAILPALARGTRHRHDCTCACGSARIRGNAPARADGTRTCGSSARAQVRVRRIAPHREDEILATISSGFHALPRQISTTSPFGPISAVARV